MKMKYGKKKMKGEQLKGVCIRPACIVITC